MVFYFPIKTEEFSLTSKKSTYVEVMSSELPTWQSSIDVKLRRLIKVLLIKVLIETTKEFCRKTVTTSKVKPRARL